MSPLPFAPKIIYNAGAVTLTLANSLASWLPDRDTVGGRSESGAGVPETYIVRKRGYLDVTLRVADSEVAGVVTWLDWVMDNGSLGFFDFYPDQTSGTHYTCYLTKPVPGDMYGFKRLSNGYLRVFELDIQLRTTNNSLFDIRV